MLKKVSRNKNFLSENKKDYKMFKPIAPMTKKIKITYWKNGVEYSREINADSFDEWKKILRDAGYNGIKKKNKHSKS